MRSQKWTGTNFYGSYSVDLPGEYMVLGQFFFFYVKAYITIYHMFLNTYLTNISITWEMYIRLVRLFFKIHPEIMFTHIGVGRQQLIQGQGWVVTELYTRQKVGLGKALCQTNIWRLGRGKEDREETGDHETKHPQRGTESAVCLLLTD